LRSQLTAPENFTPYGQPDYLAADPGIHATGVKYMPSEKNPLRGVYCRAPIRPLQDKGGIYYQAQMELYLPDNPGEIYVLDDKYPKRQDAFEIAGQRYYAIAPATPCMSGEVIAAWKIELNLERYPVTNV
jgi:hypothetical protein